MVFSVFSSEGVVELLPSSHNDVDKASESTVLATNMHDPLIVMTEAHLSRIT